eukprot:c18135_g1_i1 orf=76-750(+)
MATTMLLNAGCFQIHFTQNAVKGASTQQQRFRVLASTNDCTRGNESTKSQCVSRRDTLHMLGAGAALSTFLPQCTDALAAGLPEEVLPKLCDDVCEKELENIPTVTTDSGLKYKDIKVGSGPSPPVGFQVAANYVAMDPSGKVFDSSLAKGVVYIFRVGAGQVIKGLDEGILTMKVGGKRRLYIPGQLAYPKGLPSAAGRPRVLPNSPVMFDVSLEYVPGLDDE